MKLNKLLGACLLMQPYDSFIYSKLMPISEDDVKLTQWIIDSFKLAPDIYNNLHVSKIDSERYKIFQQRFEQYRTEHQSTTINGYSIDAYKVSDEFSFCIIVVYSEKVYIIY